MRGLIMPDHDEASSLPFLGDTSLDEKQQRPGSSAWRKFWPPLTSRPYLQGVQERLGSVKASLLRRCPSVPRSPRRRAALGASFIVVILALSLAIRGVWKATHPSHPKEPPPPPPPDRLFCSTWGSAAPIPETLWSKLYHQYRYWSRYDKPDDFFTLIPEQRPITDDEPKEIPSSRRAPSWEKNTTRTGGHTPETIWEKPRGVKVIALIFFGRPHQVDILDCYLQKNMVQQGGYLDEVHFIEHTTKMEDLEWLHNLVSATPGYKALEVGPHCREHPHQKDCRYERIWEHFATDDDTIYIKIDDDIVYVHEDTIPRLVHRRLEFAQPYAISANIVNSPLTAWLHFRLGAIHPYLPEPAPTRRAPGNPQTWRASELPVHPDDASYRNLAFPPTPDRNIMNSAIKSEEMLHDLFEDVPFAGHRWLPLTQNTTSLLYTPMSRISNHPWNNGVHNWAIAAQQHYSLLQNIEDDQMHRYYMASIPPHGEGLFNPQYTRYNLNFIAVWGKDVVEGAKVRPEITTTPEGDERTTLVSEMFDDEKNITVDIPRALGRPMVIDVQAIVAHMHFHDQEPYIQMTDLLDRWRAYVNERVCAVDRQKKVPGQMDGLGYNYLNKGLGRWQCPWVTELNDTLPEATQNPNG